MQGQANRMQSENTFLTNKVGNLRKEFDRYHEANTKLHDEVHKLEEEMEEKQNTEQ
jgi:cell division protein FtsB